MRRIVRLALWAVLVTIVLAAAGFIVLIIEVDRLGARDDAQAADAIVVLGALVTAEGRPGSDLASRTYHAVDLWQAGFAPHIICTGGFRNERLSAANVAKRFAVELGVPADVVFVADGSTNTIEDAERAATLMAAHGWRSAILVSHPLHLFRARWLFHRAGVDAVTSPTSTETGKIFPPLRVWYASREAAAILITALNSWDLIPQEWVAKLQTWNYGLP